MMRVFVILQLNLFENEHFKLINFHENFMSCRGVVGPSLYKISSWLIGQEPSNKIIKFKHIMQIVFSVKNFLSAT